MTDNTDTVRTAVVVNKITEPGESLRRTQAALPANYKAYIGYEDRIIIVGHDVAGWTMDDYVIPRLSSGLITAVEVDTLNKATYDELNEKFGWRS